MMIRSLAYDDRRLRDIGGEPLLATMVESAARCCGMGLVYEFWGVYEGRRDRVPKGFILQKGHALWATALCPEAVPEIMDFLRWRQEGWVMLCPTLSAAWRQETGETGLSLAVMALPDTVSLPESHLPEAAYCPDTATAVADCNLAVVELTPAQYETAVVNLHLAERRHVGYTVTLRQDGRAVSAAAVTDCGTRYGQISYVATLPEYEGQGLGRAVVYRCAEWLRERGRTPLIACEAHRESFYAGLGFEQVSCVTIFGAGQPEERNEEA